MIRVTEKVATAPLTGYKWGMFKITDPAKARFSEGVHPSLVLAVALTGHRRMVVDHEVRRPQCG
jgi:hypothetical protein